MLQPTASAPGDEARTAPSGSTAAWRAVFVAVVLGWHAIFLIWPARVSIFGLAVYPQFIDSIALLSAGEAAQMGWNVQGPNPLDPYRRAHSYSSLWLVLGDLGLTRQDNVWFGPFTVAVGLLAALFTVRPRRGLQAVEGLLALGGPAFVFAAYRANNDLWIFAVLAPLVPCLLHRERLARLTGPVIIAFAAALKYYPAVAGVTLLAEPDSRQRRRRIGLFGLLLVMVGLGVIGDLMQLSATQPVIDYFWSFGAVFGLRELGLSHVTLWSVLAAGLVAALAFLRRRAVVTDPEWQESSLLYFVLGAALLAGCFWAGGNWAYRWIFVAWLLPWFWRQPAMADPTGRSDLGWCVVRYGWWLPMWFTPLYNGAKWLSGAKFSSDAAAWWLSQGIDWSWFTALTFFTARLVWRRILPHAAGTVPPSAA